MSIEHLGYDHDEEQLGFAEPVQRKGRATSLRQKGAMAAVLFGLGVLLTQWTTGRFIGQWAGLLAAYLPLSLGGVLWFAVRKRGQPGSIDHDGTFFSSTKNRGSIGWLLGFLITSFYVVLYFYADLQRLHGMPAILERPMRTLDPLANALSGGPASQWFLYGFLYTLFIAVFGVRMLMKYRGNRYQQVRTLSVMFFQLAFGFILPNLLKLFHEPEFYFSYFWPLKPNYLFPSDISWLMSEGHRLGVFMVFWGAMMTFIGTPILTFYFGKRWYCSWVCGCGGLAETLGDPWRQLSNTSSRAWRVERWFIHAVLVFIVLTTGLLWANSWSEGRLFGDASLAFSKAYGLYIGMVFSGIVGVGFYPLMGSRVWCRFGCPMAAILGLLQRTWSRFRITVNGDQCMSCGNCSTYCEMGIDVRAYAEAGENIVRSSCVGCGVCSAVCPRGVLKLENGLSSKDRFDGADAGPVLVLIDSIKKGAEYPSRETMFHEERETGTKSE